MDPWKEELAREVVIFFFKLQAFPSSSKQLPVMLLVFKAKPISPSIHILATVLFFFHSEFLFLPWIFISLIHWTFARWDLSERFLVFQAQQFLNHLADIYSKSWRYVLSVRFIILAACIWFLLNCLWDSHKTTAHLGWSGTRSTRKRENSTRTGTGMYRYL